VAVSFVKGERTRNFAFVSLRYGRSGEEICTGYAMAASGRMQYDYKQTNKLPPRRSGHQVVCLHESAALHIPELQKLTTIFRASKLSLLLSYICNLETGMR